MGERITVGECRRGWKIMLPCNFSKLLGDKRYCGFDAKPCILKNVHKH